ncbi:hypothetical protein ACWCXH_35300 [Kitasatospora sp. NPDC001660]
MLGALATVLVTADLAHAADIAPAGMGDLMPSPNFKPTGGQGTLYETYSNPLLWQLDSDYGTWDVFDPMMEMPADLCMSLIAVIGSAVVVVVQWLFAVVSLPELEHAMAKAIGGAAGTLIATLLPASLAVGGLVAFGNSRRAHGSALSQIGWMIASGVMAVSLLVSPTTWVDGVDSARQIGSSAAMDAASAGIGDGATAPIDLGRPVTYTDNARDNMLRKSGDAVWRAYVATPWCVADLGSLEVCKKFGKELLDRGTDPGHRKEWLQDTVTSDEVGDDSVTWRQGHAPIGRVMVTIPSLISVIIFAALVLMLAFSCLASLLGALMLLVAGVLFACMWMIPGRPRQWGVKWFEALVGYVLQSTISTTVLGCVLILTTATTQMFGKYGWLPSAGLSIAAAVVGFRFRRVVESIVGVSTSMGPGAAVAGFMAAKGAGKAAGWLGKAIGRGVGGMSLPKFPGRSRSGGGSPGPAAPVPGGGSGGGGGFGTLGAGIPRRPLPPAPGSKTAASLPAGQPRPAALGAGSPSAPQQASSLSPATGRSVADGPSHSGAVAPPPSRRSVTASAARRPMPALPAAQSRPAVAPGDRRPAVDTTSRPAAVTSGSQAPHGSAAHPAGAQQSVSGRRPAQASAPDSPNFTFRTAPKAGASAPRVIQGKVVRSSTTPIRSSGGTAGPRPVRPTVIDTSSTPAKGRTQSAGRRFSVPGSRKK